MPVTPVFWYRYYLAALFLLAHHSMMCYKKLRRHIRENGYPVWKSFLSAQNGTPLNVCFYQNPQLLTSYCFNILYIVQSRVFSNCSFAAAYQKEATGTKGFFCVRVWQDHTDQMEIKITKRSKSNFVAAMIRFSYFLITGKMAFLYFFHTRPHHLVIRHFQYVLQMLQKHNVSNTLCTERV